MNFVTYQIRFCNISYVFRNVIDVPQ